MVKFEMDTEEGKQEGGSDHSMEDELEETPTPDAGGILSIQGST